MQIGNQQNPFTTGVPMQQYVVTDSHNTSTTNLAVGNSYTFTGTAISTLGVNAIQVTLKTDKNCILYIDQSNDGTNWDIVDTYKYYAITNNLGITVQAVGAYVRVRVVSASLTTSYFRLNTVLCPIVEALPRSLDSEGRLKITNSTYLQDIAEGDVPQHYPFHKVGYSATIGNALVDLWGVATPAAYVFPAAAMQMSIESAGANDIGNVGFSGTASGGSTTTLVDVSKNFTAGTPVAVGDIILLDGTWEHGVVTTVAATTLTVAGGFSSGGSANGQAYRVIDLSAGGTGIQVVQLNYLNTNYQQRREFIVLNGNNWVDTVSTSILRIQNLGSIAVGSVGYAVNIITLADKATRAIAYAYINIGYNSAQQAIWTVPALDYDGNPMTALYIAQWCASSSKATGTPVCQIRFVATVDRDGHLTPNVFIAHAMTTTVNNTMHHIFGSPIKFPAKADIKVRVGSDATATYFTSMFEGWLE